MSLEQKIKDKSVVAGVIGMGYVGLPLMHSICRSGIQVLGFDIDPAKIEKLNNGQSYLDTVPDDMRDRVSYAPRNKPVFFNIFF